MEEQENKIIDLKRRVCDAGEKAAEELIKIAEEPIIVDGVSIFAEEDDEEDDGHGKKKKSDELSADKLTNAAKAKKLAIMDAFEILDKVQEQRSIIEKELDPDKKETPRDWTKNMADKKEKK